MLGKKKKEATLTISEEFEQSYEAQSKQRRQYEAFYEAARPIVSKYEKDLQKLSVGLTHATFYFKDKSMPGMFLCDCANRGLHIKEVAAQNSYDYSHRYVAVSFDLSLMKVCD